MSHDRLPPLPILHPRAPVESRDNPIQMPGTDRCINRTTVGGPSSSQDIRFMVSAPILEELLAAARASQTRRAVIYEAGFMVSTWIVDAHVLQTITILGRRPVPESPAILGLQQTPSAAETFSEPEWAALRPGWVKQGSRMIGGPGHPVRLILSQALLEQVLDRAGASRTRRAVIHRAGLVIDTYQPDPPAPPYQIVTIMGMTPQPEDPTLITRA